MKNLLIYLCLIGCLFVGGRAQTQTQAPPPQQQAPSRDEVRQQQQQQQENARQIQEERSRQIFQQQQRIENQARSQNLRIISEITSGNIVVDRNIINSSNSAASQRITALYRKTNKAELKLLAPNKEDQDKFAGFLRQDNTGLIKLVKDKGCADNPNVVVVTSDCLAYTMPGAGSSYSFRVKDYRIPRLADITFTERAFQSRGNALHGIFAEIGDVPLEQVNLQTKGLGFLVNFKPEADVKKADELDKKMRKGITADGFLYRRAVPVKANTTYILRSIAYRGVYPQAVQRYVYNEFEFDKREDVIVAFRIVRRYDDGAVLILWKRLAQKTSPKLKQASENKDTQINNSNFTAKTMPLGSN